VARRRIRAAVAGGRRGERTPIGAVKLSMMQFSAGLRYIGRRR